MFAHVEADIVRGYDDQLWVPKGDYPVLRRFDQNRWIIVVDHMPKRPHERTLTIVHSSEIRLSTNEGE